MRRMVKRVKNGQEVTFTCSQCGDLIHDMFVPIGKSCEPNWDKIPEKCSCGARLTSRIPIIDTSGANTGYVDTMNDENVRNNTHGDISEKSDVYTRYIRDLETAMSVDYFDMRLNSLKRYSIKIPDDIDYLRIECIKRNISHAELNVKHLSSTNNINEKEDAQDHLDDLRQKYNDLLSKLENKKGAKKDFDNFDKKRDSNKDNFKSPKDER